MDLLQQYSESFGIKSNEVFNDKIKQEYRYLIIIEVIHKNKTYSASNVKPINNIKKAKEIAFKKLKERIKFKITEKNYITISGMEFLYSDVPVENILKEHSTEMQSIKSRWLTNDELEVLLK